MESKKPLLNFERLNWKVIMLFGIALFYAGLIVIWGQEKNSPIHYGGDYLAFWSTGKLADEKGFSQIYDLQQIKSIQAQTLEELSLLGDKSSFIALPAPYFSIFMIPFKYLSRINIQTSYMIWSLVNLACLIGYLWFFIRDTIPGKNNPNVILLFLLVLFSFPVFDNFVNGQLNVFLLVCVGEFIRNAVKQRPFISGLWLGGLLLKPQVLILIIPVLLVQRQWKAFWGFIASSASIFLASLALSGVTGMLDYGRLLTGWGQGNSVTAPEAMVNWRMVGAYINIYLGSPFGWIIAGIGVLLTLAAVYKLIRKRLEFGSPKWVLVMLGVMAATLVVTWHAHAHMAVVILPLLIYAVSQGLLSEGNEFAWTSITPAAWFGILILGYIMQKVLGVDILPFQGMVVAISGFIANMMVLAFVIKEYI